MFVDSKKTRKLRAWSYPRTAETWQLENPCEHLGQLVQSFKNPWKFDLKRIYCQFGTEEFYKQPFLQRWICHWIALPPMKPKASSEDAMYAAWQNEADANGNEALEEVEEMGEGEGEEEEEMEDDQNAE